MRGAAPQDSVPTGTATAASLPGRLRAAWIVEFSNLRLRVTLCTLAVRLLPEGRAPAIRTALLRAMGLTIGARTRFLGMPKVQSSPAGSLKGRLRIGADCTIGTGVILEFGETLTIGDRVCLADRAVILTTTHKIGPARHRAGASVRLPVVIGDDVRIGEGAIVLPGVTIGDAARVLSGSVVNVSVAPGATASGIPARATSGS